MRPLVLVSLAALACGSAPPPRKEAPPPRAKRDLTMRLETDYGEARIVIDGVERLRSTPNRAGSISIDLVQGDHPVVLRGRPSEYGGMGIRSEFSSASLPLLSFRCSRPCDEKRITAWRQGIEAQMAGSAGCGGAELRGLGAHTENNGAFEVNFTIRVAPPLTPEERAARRCP
jgi:hypothetical protein